MEDLAVTVESSARLDSRIMRGSAWVAVSYGGSHIVSLLTTLALVRLLDPKAFGLVALAWTVLIITDQIQNAGAAAALVYRRDDVTRSAGSAFAFVLVSGLVLFAITLVVAPPLAEAFDAPELTSVLRVMGLILIAKSLGAIPFAILDRNIDFRSRAKCELSGAAVQAAVSVSLAAMGFGVWSLVAAQVAGIWVQTGLSWVVIPWRPDLRQASFGVVRDLLRYGRYVSATNIVNLANNTADNVLIGRLLGVASLGIYAVAFRLADFPNTVIAHVVGRVMFPVYALLQSERERFRRAYIQNLQRIAVLALPVSVTLLVAAEPIVNGLLGSKWQAAVTPLRILAAYGLVKSFTAPAGEVFKGAGRPGLGLAVSMLQIAVLLPALLWLVPGKGITGAAMAMLIAIVVSGAVRLVLAQRLLSGTFVEIARALAAPALCAGLLGVSLVLIEPGAETLGPEGGLAVLAAAGIAVYVSATALFARGVVGPMWAGLRGPQSGMAA
jgi:O-antigen/teichoic acid export membrane protein